MSHEGTCLLFLNLFLKVFLAFSLSLLSPLFSLTILEKGQPRPTILSATCAWSPNDEEDCTGVPWWSILHWAAWKKKEQDGTILRETRKRNVCVYMCVCVRYAWQRRAAGRSRAVGQVRGMIPSSRANNSPVPTELRQPENRPGLSARLVVARSFIRRTVCPFACCLRRLFFARHCRLYDGCVGRRRPTVATIGAFFLSFYYTLQCTSAPYNNKLPFDASSNPKFSVSGLSKIVHVILWKINTVINRK